MTKITTENIERAADLLWEANERKVACSPIREWIGDQDLSAAYRVQQINTERKQNLGHRLVGAKIGLTSKAVQAQLGVDQPDFGWLTDRMQVANNGSISIKDLMQPKAEAEIAFVLNEDISDKHLDHEALKRCISHAVASIEIVGSRIENWNIRITDTIADNASASHFVLGETKAPVLDLDLEGAQMKLYQNEELVSKGSASACLGNPLNAVAWLADAMIDLGTPLTKGSVILAGALGPMVNVKAGDQLRAEIDGLGSVQVAFNS